MDSDAIGHIGLDIRDFQESIKKAEKATGALAKAGIIATGVFLAFGATLNNFRNIGKEVDELRGKFIEGSKEGEALKDTLGDINAADLSALRHAGHDIDNLWLKTKLFLAQSFLGWKKWGQDVADVIARVTGLGSPSHGATSHETPETDHTPKIVALENELLMLRTKNNEITGDTTMSLQQRVAILDKEVELEEERLARAIQYEDRISQMAHAEVIHGLRRNKLALELEDIENQRDAEHARMLHNAHLPLEQALVAEAEIRFKYEQKIVEALAKGKNEMAQTLRLAQDTALAEEKVARKRQTAAQKVDARAEGRAFERDLKKQGARDADLSDRARRGVQGREVDEWRGRQKMARAQGGRVDAVAHAVGQVGEAQFYAQGLTALQSIDKKLDTAFKMK